MAAHHVIPGLTRALGTRPVHLRIYPSPPTLAENREVLRLLQSYGKVEMFKSLKYDALPSRTSMLAIFETEEAANALLRASPLRFTISLDDEQLPRLETEGTSETPAPPPTTTPSPQPDASASHDLQNMSSDRQALAQDAARKAAAAAQPRRTSANAFSRPGASPLVEYQLQINIATMNHRDHINVNPYNGPFYVNTKSQVQADLAKRVPLIGQSDINLKKPEKPWKVLGFEAFKEPRTYKPLGSLLEEGRKERIANPQPRHETRFPDEDPLRARRPSPRAQIAPLQAHSSPQAHNPSLSALLQEVSKTGR